MAIGGQQYQVGQSVMLVVAIPMMPCAMLIVLEHLVADGATPLLLVQDFRTKCRRRLQRQLPLAVLKGRLPWGIERVGVALDLDRTLMVARLLHADALLPGGGVGEPPRLPRSMGKGARSKPASRCVRVTEFRPPRQPSPYAAVTCRQCRATDDVAVGVRPTPSHGVEGIDALFRRGPRSLVTEGLDLGFDGLEARLAGGHLQRGPFPSAPLMCAQGLPSEVKALREGRDDGLRRGEPDTAFCSTGGDPWQDSVFSDLPRIGGDKEVVSPSYVVDVVHPSMPAATVHDGFKAVQHPSADHRGDDPSLRDPGCGRKQGAAIHKATAKPWRQHVLVHG